MKKLVFILGLSLLLASCGQAIDEVVLTPSPDGIEVDYSIVFGKVDFMDESSVEFVINGSSQTYPFSEDAVIRVVQGETLTEMSPKAAMFAIMTSSNLNDYYFNFVLSDDAVLEMTQVKIDISAENESALFYISSPMMSEGGVTDGDGFLTIDSVQWLGEGDCATEGLNVVGEEIPLPSCNPNGFLILNEFLDLQTLDVSNYVIVRTTNFGTIPEATYEMTFEELVAAYEANKDYFITAPFEIAAAMVATDGPEYEIITLIQEKYIP